MVPDRPWEMGVRATEPQLNQASKQPISIVNANAGQSTGSYVYG